MSNNLRSQSSAKLVGFPPLINKSPRIIILGSMPGVESLRQQQYYGHPRNQFWAIMQSLLKCINAENYNDKKKMLLDHHIILWDVIHSCRRNGSLDSNLRDVKINDIKQILDKRSTVCAIFCNGQTAFKLFNRYYGDIDLPAFALPSTSPAYTLPLRMKLSKWRKILKFIRST